jgi:hypothetical protein
MTKPAASVIPMPPISWKIPPARGVLADRPRAAGVVGASQVWRGASGWVCWDRRRLGENSPRMHDTIDRRVSAFLQGLASSQTGVHSGRPDESACLAKDNETTHDPLAGSASSSALSTSQ